MGTLKDSKRECCIIHVKKRFRERFGITITDKDIADAVADIQVGYNAVALKKQSVNRTLFSVKIQGNYYNVIYDKKRKVIVTVLFDEMADTHI